MELQEKIRKASKGDGKAFQDLIQNEKLKLYRIAYLYVKNENDALDLVQDTVYKAFISIKKLKNPNHFSSWLTQILINTAINFIKKNNRMIPFDEMEGFGNEGNLLLEDSIDLVTAIERLEEQYKTVIILRYYKDFTIKQIAEMLKCPEGTVKTKLHRAIKRLKLDLGEECIQ